MKIQFQRWRRRAGFSLVEMLVVVGIVGILLGVAVPSIIHYRRELKLTELDDGARTIFIAAQNHLTALRSASSDKLEVGDGVGRPAQNAPDAVNTQAGTALMYVSTDVSNAGPGWLVLPGSIESDLAEGSYLVEFDPVSGSVYGVFFTEKKDGKPLDEAAYQKLYNNAGGANCRIREGRKAFCQASDGFFVGYYGADGALDVDRPDAQKLPVPKLKLTNAEELRLEIDTDSWPSGIGADKVFASVSVSSDGFAAKTLVSKGAVQSGTKATVVLDTLKTSSYGRNEIQNTAGWTVGAPFAKWMEASGGYTITPGADLTITVSIWYQPGAGEGVVVLPQSASVTTNSLFAGRSENTVQVAYGRHLQNLDLNTSHLDAAVTDVRQTRSINFAQAGGGLYSWEDTYGHDAQPFVPIENSNLKTYHGGGQIIRDLNAVKASGRYDNAGLFGVFSGSRLESITLVDAKASGSATAGALAGKATSTTVDSCQVSLASISETARIQGGNFAGGLMGAAESCTVQNGSFASTVVNGGVATGGLIGQATNNTAIQSSYAAGHLSGATVGGLVGSGYARIQNCYAAGTIASATTAAGGLCGTDANVYASYAAVDYVQLPSSGNVYGAVPGGSCTNVYYLAKSGVNDSKTVGGVTAITNPDQMNDDAMLINLGKTIFSKGNAGVIAKPYNLPNQADKTRDPKLSAPYPYPTLGELPHYGDWLEVDTSSVYLAYFEQYADGSYGYQYPTSSGEESTLRDDKGALRNEGYALISKEDPKVVQVAGVDAGWTKHTETFTDSAGDTFNIYILATDLAQTRHTKAPELGNTSVEYGGYCELTVDGSKLWFNPDFAKTTALTKPGTANAYTIRSIRHFNNMRRYPASIGTWTQELDLDGALYEGYQADGKIAGMATATGTDGSRYLCMEPITMLSAAEAKDSWNKTYDGGGHTIRHVSIRAIKGVGEEGSKDKDKSYAGLFARTVSEDARIKDLTLENCDIAGEKLGSEAAYTGALVAWSEGPVENCYAVNCKVTASAGYEGGLLGMARQGTVKNCGVRAENASDYDSYTVSGGQYVGGFAGIERDAVIEHCYAAVKVSGETAGGFAGQLEFGKADVGIIKNSYAGGHTVDGAYSADDPNVNGTKLAGGFIGAVKKSVTIENVYTTCSVGVPKGKTADVFGPEVTAAPSGFAYAVGDVFVDGAAVAVSAYNKAGVKFRPSYSGAMAAAHPYDTTLPGQYPYQPVTAADGKPLDHYGDWYRKSGRSHFEWDQPETEPLEPEEWVKQLRDKLTMEAKWNEDGMLELVVHMDTKRWDGDTVAGLLSSGSLAIWSDLSYTTLLKVEADYSQPSDAYGGNRGIKVNSAAGYLEVSQTLSPPAPVDWQNCDITYSYTIKIPPEILPPYLREISIGPFQEAAKATVTNHPDHPTYKPQTELLPSKVHPISVTDSSFTDWEGYEHKLMTRYNAKDEWIHGMVQGAVYGEGNDIYVHINNRSSDIQNAGLVAGEGNLSQMAIFNLNMVVTLDDGTVIWQTPGGYEWWRLTHNTYHGNGFYTMTKDDGSVLNGTNGLTCLETYLEASATSQEMEMLIRLDSIYGKDIADRIVKVQFENSTYGWTLEATRHDKES